MSVGKSGCPMCGNRARVFMRDQHYFVQCTECGLKTVEMETEAEALAKWNIRKTNTPFENAKYMTTPELIQRYGFSRSNGLMVRGDYVVECENIRDFLLGIAWMESQNDKK